MIVSVKISSKQSNVMEMAEKTGPAKTLVALLVWLSPSSHCVDTYSMSDKKKKTVSASIANSAIMSSSSSTKGRMWE